MASGPMPSSRTCCCIRAKARANTGLFILMLSSKKALISLGMGRGSRGRALRSRSNNPLIRQPAQDITRALLNLILNGFYAAAKRRAETNGGNYEPTIVAATKDLGDRVEITIRDNGTGIPPDVKEKMFNPF